ncbi:hypothetical protein CP981_03070 [Streptomyces platensis]|uniref:Uncharacterized protein n=1 Tax=Streptomyces platensis TaxID=58346 RepID=A0AAE6NEN3_STRPT|nr:hypothetical protein BG653_01554 [Streptomyces platensis]QEV50786.1 hypothetical protein CP981_03070 [Streptomyces platensis]
MSVNPVLAALVGLVVLRQTLRGIEWPAVFAIVVANAVSILAAGRRPVSPPVARGGTALPVPATSRAPAAGPAASHGPQAGAPARCDAC